MRMTIFKSRNFFYLVLKFTKIRRVFYECTLPIHYYFLPYSSFIVIESIFLKIKWKSKIFLDWLLCVMFSLQLKYFFTEAMRWFQPRVTRLGSAFSPLCHEQVNCVGHSSNKKYMTFFALLYLLLSYTEGEKCRLSFLLHTDQRKSDSYWCFSLWFLTRTLWNCFKYLIRVA